MRIALQLTTHKSSTFSHCNNTCNMKVKQGSEEEPKTMLLMKMDRSAGVALTKAMRLKVTLEKAISLPGSPAREPPAQIPPFLDRRAFARCYCWRDKPPRTAQFPPGQHVGQQLRSKAVWRSNFSPVPSIARCQWGSIHVKVVISIICPPTLH